MSVLFKDLLIGVALVCLMLAFTSLTQARNLAPAEIQPPGSQLEVFGKSNSPVNKAIT